MLKFGSLAAVAEGDVLDLPAAALEDVPRVENSQEDLTVVFQNERDGVLLVPEGRA